MCAAFTVRTHWQEVGTVVQQVVYLSYIRLCPAILFKHLNAYFFCNSSFSEVRKKDKREVEEDEVEDEKKDEEKKEKEENEEKEEVKGFNQN